MKKKAETTIEPTTEAVDTAQVAAPEWSCPICGGTHWKSFDGYRDPRVWVEQDLLDVRDPVIGFGACKTCGHFTYRNNRNLKAHYEDTYRKHVNGKNLITCNRKFEYHKAFLQGLFEPGAGKRVVDFGCAYGHNLHQFRSFGCETRGYELTGGFRKFGQHILGLDIRTEWEEEPESCDLIICYHVLEHLEDPVGQLLKFKEALKPDGTIHMAVPEWFATLEEGGGEDMGSFEKLFHIDHIQVFSREAFFNVIRKAGLVPVRFNDQTYGMTIALKKEGEPMQGWKTEHVNENLGIKSDILRKQKQAIEEYKRVQSLGPHKFDEMKGVLDIYPNFPDAWCHYAEAKMRVFPEKVAILSEAMKVCQSKYRLINYLASVYFQWDMQNHRGEYTNNIKIAEDLFNQTLAIKPLNEIALYHLGVIHFQHKNDPKAAAQLWQAMIAVNPARWEEVQTYLGMAAAKMGDAS